MTSSRRSPSEIFVIAVMVSLTILVSMSIYAGRSEVQKERVLIEELGRFRLASILYRTLQRTSALDVDALASAEYQGADERQERLLQNLPRDSHGRILDPFGRPYVYDSRTGWISSATEGYEAW